MKKIVLFSLSFLLVIGLTLSFIFIKKSAKADWSNPEIEELYDLNETFVMPIITYSDNGFDYPASTTLEFPDGTIKNESIIVLDQMGIYTLHSIAQVGTKIKKNDLTFKVLGKYYTHSGATLAKYMSDNSEFKAQDVFTYDYQGEGLYVSLAQNDTLKFSKLIDVSNLSHSDSVPFIEAYVLPQTPGLYDFDHLIFTLTDSENPEITLSFMANRVTNNADWAKATTYVMAYANGQYPTGAEYSGQNIAKLHINDGWGTAFNHTFIKVNSSGEDYDPATQPIRLWYDAQDLSCWCYSYGGARMEIADMDDTYFFSNVWGGFKSGKAKLSITATDFNGNRKANFVLKSVNGLDLSQVDFEDTNAPVISVDTEYNLQAMPEGEIDKAYPIPNANAKDDYDGERVVTTKVYYAYNTDGQIEFKVKDNAFTPDRNGNYAIEYTSKDTNGNVGKKVVFIHAGQALDPITISYNSEKITTINLGSMLDIPQVSYSGGSGNLKLEVTVSDGVNTYIVDDFKFRPEVFKEYTITYTVTDYLSNKKTESYKVETIKDSKSVFVDEVLLPKVFCASQGYILPEYYLNNYSTGEKVQVLGKYRITDDSGTKVYNALERFVPVINGDESEVTIEIFDETISKTFKVPLIKSFNQKAPTVASQVYFDRYFYTNDFSKERTKSGIIFTALSDKASANIIFANKLIARALRFDFKSFAGDFTSIDIYLEDELNPLNIIKATLYKGANNLGIFEYNGERIELEGLFNKDSSFTIGFNQDNEFYINNASLRQSPSFNGFESEKVYVKIVFNDVLKDTTFTVNRINNHTLSSASTDTIKPEIKVLGNYGGTYSINNEYHIVKAVSGDVFAINVNFTLTVLDPSGEYVIDKNGVVLNGVDPFKDYYINLSEYGRYSVAYKSTEIEFGPESMAQSIDFRYVINVNDREKPNLEIVSSYGTYKVGDEVELPKYTVEDNKSSRENITVIKYIVSPNGIVRIADGTALVLNQVGTYEFRVMAIDEAGNITLKSVKVVVGGN